MSTAHVTCPRCTDSIECTATPRTVTTDSRNAFTVSVDVPDLAVRMAGHYSEKHADLEAVGK